MGSGSRRLSRNVVVTAIILISINLFLNTLGIFGTSNGLMNSEMKNPSTSHNRRKKEIETSLLRSQFNDSLNPSSHISKQIVHNQYAPQNDEPNRLTTSKSNLNNSGTLTGSSESLSALEKSENVTAMNKYTKEPIKVTVKNSDKAILPCVLSNSTNAKQISRTYKSRPALWKHNGLPVDMITIDTRSEQSGTGHRYIGDSTTHSLHIDNIRLEDDGNWSCFIYDERGKLHEGKMINLIVIDAPRSAYLLIDGRRLDPGNMFVPVKEGSELVIECISEGGNPPPVLSWKIRLSESNSKSYSKVSPNVTIQHHNLPRVTTAYVRVTREHNNATIICLVEHMALTSPISSSLLLDVQYTPSFAITRIPSFGIPINEGMFVSLKCDVDSNPQSSPTWQKDNSDLTLPVEVNGWINFTRINRNNSGWYKCFTRHSTGIFSSIGYFLNVRYSTSETGYVTLNGAMKPKKLEVKLGSDIALECEGGCWSKDTSFPSNETLGNFKLENIIYQDAGKYICVTPDRGNHNKWRMEAAYQLDVKGKPLIYPTTQNLDAYDGDSVDIIVEFCSQSDYTTALWLLKKTVYIPGDQADHDVRALPVKATTTPFCHESVLRISSVRHTHSGEWIFFMRSKHGSADATIFLNVTSANSYNYAQSPRHNSSCIFGFSIMCLKFFFLHAIFICGKRW